MKAIVAWGEEITLKRKIVISNESQKRIDDHGIEIYPVELFLRELWGDEIIKVN